MKLIYYYLGKSDRRNEDSQQAKEGNFQQ